MVKQRHQSTQNIDPTPSRTPMAFLVVGALLVAGLVVWALTRTVQAPTNVPTYTSEATTAPSTTYDTAGTTQPPETSPIASPITPSPVMPPIASTTAGVATSSHAPMIEGNKSEVPRISAEDLREKVKAGAVTVIDVRDISAFQAAHIPGSLHIPLASVEANLDRLPKGKPIVAYCT